MLNILKKIGSLSNNVITRYLSVSSTDLIITPSCVKKINELNSISKINSKLRISVNSGGCSGFSYIFNIDNSVLQEGDKIAVKDGIEVVVDEMSWEFIKGSIIDYDIGMMRSAFKVSNNPQSATACGCGTSFAVKNFLENSVAH